MCNFARRLINLQVMTLLKKCLPDELAVLLFAVLAFAYFFPADIEGRILYRHDASAGRGAGQEGIEYLQKTGERSRWTNALFGGMPTYQMAPSYHSTDNLTQAINAYHLWLPENVWYVFAYLLGFYILLRAFDFRQHLAALGSIIWAFSTYFLIIIAAGHIWKVWALAYLPPLIAGIVLAYRGKYLWGFIVTAIFTAFEINANHVQMTYYYAFIILFLIIAWLVEAIREKQLVRFAKATGVALAAGILGLCMNLSNLYHTWQYSQESMRGKSELVKQNAANQTNSGLERDYITQWSYGIGETWTLLVPNTKGGASVPLSHNETAMAKADPNFMEIYNQIGQYWGEQPGTSGPVYVGAFVMFLFILGLFIVKGPIKWALLAATILSILLSWGKNFMGFTDFFLDHVPGYDKFRAVSMTLVMAEVTMPLLGFLGLAEIAKSPESFKQNLKKFYIALGITAGICLLFYIAPKAFFSFLSQGEAEQFAQLSSGKDGALYQTFATQLEDVRVAIFRKDTLRSLIFILLSAVPIFLYGKGKLKAAPAFAILAALVLIDMFPIDKRYLNNDNFIDKARYNKPFVASAADQSIMNDKTLDFRVADITKDMFNDASTCYFHKSLGGYSGAKLRRYQDVITQYLGGELNQLRSARTGDELVDKLSRTSVLNMLNTKYVIYNPNAPALPNPFAFGNAWIPNDILWVDTPNEEIDALGSTDLAHTAILHKEFAQQVGNYRLTDSIKPQITLTEYLPNKLTYKFSGVSTGSTTAIYPVVFSEIWTEKGWKLFVDGQEQPLLRANYLLRCALIPSGEHDIVMEYAPKAWKVGNTVSFASSLIMILGLIGALIITFKPKKGEKA